MSFRLRRHQKLRPPHYHKRRILSRFLSRKWLFLSFSFMGEYFVTGPGSGSTTSSSRTSAGLPLGATSLTGDQLFPSEFRLKFCIFYRKSTVLWDVSGDGAPEQWSTAQAQFEPKIMVLNVIWGNFKPNIFFKLFNIVLHRGRNGVWAICDPQ